MDRRGGRPRSGSEIRGDAETVLSAARPARLAADVDAVRTLHELQVHQIELEMQNDELRQARLDLEEGRDLYWALYDRAPFGYLTLAHDGAIVEVNRTATTLLGIDRSRLIGRPLSAFMDRADADRFHLYRQADAARGTRGACDVALRRSDGGLIEVRLETAAEGAGKNARWQTVIVDISDLRRAERELRESEARFRQLADHVEDAFYIREPAGRISYVSPAFERIWGRSAAWLAGRDNGWQETIDPEDRGRVAAAWKRLCEGAPMSESYRIQRPDGTTRWVHSRSFVVPADDGRGLRSVGVVRDISSERALEEQLRHAQKMEAVGTLAGGVAHNLRNVLQAVLGSIEVAQSLGADSPDGAHALERAVCATQRGAALIEQLMTFAHKHEGTITLGPVHLDDTIREAEGLLRTLVGRRVHLEIELGSPGSVVMADPVQFEQILLNLAANARDAMSEGGTLAIRSRAALLDEPTAKMRRVAPGPHVIVTVRDTGCGMDAATKARIFEPFFTTKGVGKGTGLGLSTVFTLVQQFAGYIDVESAPAAGTTFSVCLPALQNPIVDAGGVGP
jgi:two-component system cell cycle sensor histidine kinase/response regulator CckA